MGLACVVITGTAMVILAVWQSGHYNKLAQDEVNALINADLDHITRGVWNLVKSTNEAVQEKVNSNLKVARHILSASGKVRLSDETMEWTAVNQFTNQPSVVNLRKFYVGNRPFEKIISMAVNAPVVDEVTRLVGETATLFQRMNRKGDMLRIATTVKSAGGQRAIGTYIPAENPDGTPNPVVSEILNGNTYHGRACVVNAWYLTAYEPVTDASGKLVGMLYVGVEQENVISRLKETIYRTSVGKTGYVYVLGGKGKDRGHYIISFKGERDGEDVWMERDSDGRYVIQEIIEKSIMLNPGEMATIRYRWQNPGENEPRWKIARLVYYKPWDWIIGTSVYEDELEVYWTVLERGRARMIRVMILGGSIIGILVMMSAVFVSWNIIHPVRQMTAVAEKIIDGDLDQKVRVDSKDEIGVLGSTFNQMTGKLKRVMETLAGSEEKYRLIYENALEGLFRTSLNGRFINANPSIAAILGYDSPEDLMQSIKNISTDLYVRPEDRNFFVNTLREEGFISGFEIKLRKKDGSEIWAFVSARLVHEDNGGSSYIEGFIADINDRKQAEENLAETSNYLNEIINSVPEPVFVKDSELRWVLVNDAMCGFLGNTRENILGKTAYEFLNKEQADIFRKKDEYILLTGNTDINEETYILKDGDVHNLVTKKARYTDKKGNKFVVGLIKDITDIRKTEEEKAQLETKLVQAQKMEAIGTLAGGIAHDFNNILAVIIGYAELAMNTVSDNLQVNGHLKEVLTAGNRAKDLVKQILTFSRMAEVKYSPINITIIIKESLKMLRSVIPSTIEIKQNIAASGLVMSDPTQLNQIIINLCTNAAHAMDEAGGIIEVELHDDEVDEKEAEKTGDIMPGSYFKLSVRDTGKGIPPEIIDKIFEPYFTTKKTGQGTGLGLSVIHGIIKSHNGTIKVSSNMDEGTVFTIFLPRIKSEDKNSIIEAEYSLEKGSGRILYVDDEPIITKMGAEILGSLGYSVVTMTSSTEALEIFRSDPDGFDLVIIDMTMPGLTGAKFAEELISIRSNVRIILCSGYNEHISEEKAKEIGIKEFILKPITLSKLSGTVKKVLNNNQDTV
ncbi:MAG: Cache 3/Cache 2 fusion domain-containing protein [Spirochaetes bacterium]|nr:Cache 3/Cache 2 fusion domain-containing protein [Spirochaetota bacterium]